MTSSDQQSSGLARRAESLRNSVLRCLSAVSRHTAERRDRSGRNIKTMVAARVLELDQYLGGGAIALDRSAASDAARALHWDEIRAMLRESYDRVRQHIAAETSVIPDDRDMLKLALLEQIGPRADQALLAAIAEVLDDADTGAISPLAQAPRADRQRSVQKRPD